MNGLRLYIGSTLLAVSFGAVADVYTVTNNSGSVIPGSFREAVQLANANPGLDEIEFSLPPSSSLIINLLEPVLVTGPVIINGSTQSGFAGTPVIRLIAPPAPTVDMNGPGVIRLDPGSDGSVISDLSFTAPEETNYLEAASDLIILNSAFNLFYNCRVGVDFVPTILPIRGVTSVDIGNTIAHCIVGKCNYGIAMAQADGTWIVDNAIGTDFSGTQDYGCIGSGILALRSAGVIIGPIGNEPGNIIANNGDWAIISAWPPLADDYSNISVRKNRIYNHSDIPFKIGVEGSNIIHPNDSGDHDFLNQTGPQNHAILNFAGRGDKQFTIIGSVDSTPNTSFVIDFFANDALAPLVHGEGQYYLGSTTVTSGPNGKAFFSATVSDTAAPVSSNWISALTSRAVGGATSQFSPSIEASDMIPYKEPNPELDLEWVPSGLDSGPESPVDPGSPDDVDIAKGAGALEVIVRPSIGRYRIAGWHHPSVVNMASNINLDMYIGKFYVTTSNPPSAPLNTVPNFRIRLENEGAVVASATFQYAATGEGGTPHEPDYDATNNLDREIRAGESLRPSSNPAKPSLYRVQFVPIPVPATHNTNIGATFESYATPNPADGTLSLTEVTVAKYPLLLITNEAEPLFTYTRDLDYVASVEPSSSSAEYVPGSFNAEADFQPGRRQTIDLPSEVGTAVMAQVFETMSNGTMVDTLQTPTDKFGLGLMGIISNDPQQAPRVEPGKTYVAEFAATSDIITSSNADVDPRQGAIFFEIQTGLGAVVHRLELSGAVSAEASLTKSGEIAAETLPGIGCVNPISFGFGPPGEDGGYYYVCMPTPLDPDIRADTGGALGVFATQPGPGVNSTSARDITLGVIGMELPENLRLSPTLVVPFAPPNRSRVRLLGATLFELPPINDGGYAY